LSIFSRTIKSLPGPIQLPFIGGISFLLQKPQGNNNNNNNNNNNTFNF